VAVIATNRWPPGYDGTGLLQHFEIFFISHMIEHHQAAVDMARLSAQNAKHEEIKKLSREIIVAQEKEIAQMKQWQQQWGYSAHGNAGH